MRVLSACILSGLAILCVACGGGIAQPRVMPSTSTSAPSPQPAMGSAQEIARADNRGQNDLAGKSDDTPHRPIIAAATDAVRTHFGGKVTIVGEPRVSHIIDSQKTWNVVGDFEALNDSRRDFTCLVRRKGEAFEAILLLLDDDVVFSADIPHSEPAADDAGSAPASSSPAEKTRSPKIRTWTAGPHSVEAEFITRLGENVNLRRLDDGREITVLVSRLSDADRKWLEEYASHVHLPEVAAAKHRPKTAPKAKHESHSAAVDPPPASSYAGSGGGGGGVVHVRGYFRKDGTYVRPHTRSAPRR